MARVAAVQSWPALIRDAATAPWTAASRSASSKTTNGALPPSSRCTRLPVAEAVGHHLATDAGRAGERGHRDVGVADQVLAGDRPGAGDDVDDAGGGAGLGERPRRRPGWSAG